MRPRCDRRLTTDTLLSSGFKARNFWGNSHPNPLPQGEGTLIRIRAIQTFLPELFGEIVVLEHFLTLGRIVEFDPRFTLLRPIEEKPR